MESGSFLRILRGVNVVGGWKGDAIKFFVLIVTKKTCSDESNVTFKTCKYSSHLFFLKIRLFY